MLRVGVTGGIAAGKSTVVGALRGLGAVVVDADAIARDVLSPGSPAVHDVATAFGDGVVGSGGVVDRAALGRRVFADPAARVRLEQITHPLIQAETARRFAAVPDDAVAVHDIPLLVELGMTDRYHLVVVVLAPEHERVRRLVTERAMSEADARARIRAQADDEARRAAGDVWLDNTGARSDLGGVVAALWRDRLAPFEAGLRHRTRAPRPARPVIADPDPRWADQGSRLAARVRRAAGERALRVDHVGSTAVPGLPTEDVIDLQVVTADLATARVVADDLVAAGLVAEQRPYRDAPLSAPGTQVPKAFAANADPGRAVNCHVRSADNPAVGEVLGVRDRLRADPVARDAYARLKRDLASRPWADIDAYADAKARFLAALLAS